MAKTNDIFEAVKAFFIEPMYTRKDLAVRYGVSVETIDDWRRRKVIPKPVMVAGRFPRWRLMDLRSIEVENSR